MISWREEYLQSLKDHDKHINGDHELIDAYTRLADRAAVLEADRAAKESQSAHLSKPNESPPPGVSTGQASSNLAEALRAKGQLQARLKAAEDELEKLRARKLSDAETIKELSSERTILITKVKDRDEELKGKTKLVEEVQDEMVSLNLQLNMAEQRSQKLLNDNKDLIDRWMARKGEEAEAMNNASKFS